MPPKQKKKAPASKPRKSVSTAVTTTKKVKDISSASSGSSDSSSAGSLPELVKKISGKLGKSKSKVAQSVAPAKPRRRVSHMCGNGKLDANSCTLTELRKVR